jgi:ankyrin repeat protein
VRVNLILSYRQYGMTPLHCATVNSEIEVMTYLLEHGADPTLRSPVVRISLICFFELSHDQQNWTPLETALSNKDSEICAPILQRYLVSSSVRPTSPRLTFDPHSHPSHPRTSGEGRLGLVSIPMLPSRSLPRPLLSHADPLSRR